MKSIFHFSRLSVRVSNRSEILLALLLVAGLLANFLQASQASRGGEATPPTSVEPRPAMDTCLTATAIDPGALPFLDDSTTVGAVNDLEGACAPGPGPDVVYRFTPTATDVYTIGATPFDVNYDLSIYVIADCASPAGSCLAGDNTNSVGKSEFVTPTLNAGTTYFIVIDSPIAGNAGAFHFSLRRGTPTNETCASPIVVNASQLPFSTMGTTFGAANDLNPASPCLRSNATARGGEVVFQFTPADTQTYVLRARPLANFDVSVYVVTNCSTFAGCSASDVFGGGDVEELRRPLTEGVTYFVVVDGFRNEAGDFTLDIEPTIPIAPDAPSNLVATAINGNRVDLMWRDNSDNEQGFRIERSLDGSAFTPIGTTGPNATTFSDTTVEPRMTYFYRVFAFNSFGSSPPSNIASATTPEPPPPPVPVITITPDPLDFGTVNISLDLPVTVMNIGGANLVISAISNPNAPFSLVNPPAVPITLATGQSVDITVRFQPTNAQLFTGTFNIQSNDPARPSVAVNLRGIGAAAPVPNLDFGSLLVNFPSGESVQSIDVRNTGNADLLISSIRPPRAPFAISGAPPLPVTVSPGEGFVLNISFSPAAPGAFLSEITFVTSDPDALVAILRLRGLSTPENEQLKLKAPTLVTAPLGQTRTLNVISTNGTNTDIRLTATNIAGGTFTDRGNGRGDLVYTPPAATSGNQRVTVTARDSANRAKSIQMIISVVEAASTHNVQILFTAPETASNPPTNLLANDQSITPLGANHEPVDGQGIEPQVAAGLTGYAIFRSNNPNVQESLANIVGVIPASATSFTDIVPTPGGSTQVFYYSATALYQTATESTPSNETSTAPRMIGLEYKKKAVRFQQANSNVAVGAVMIVNSTETFQLTRSGVFILVDKDARSSPGNMRPRDIFRTGTSNRVQIRNPNGVVSTTETITR